MNPEDLEHTVERLDDDVTALTKDVERLKKENVELKQIALGAVNLSARSLVVWNDETLIRKLNRWKDYALLRQEVDLWRKRCEALGATPEILQSDNPPS